MLRKVLKGHHRICIDTCIWIYHLEAHPEYAALTSALLNHVESGQTNAISSEITLMELIVQPLRSRRFDIADHYELLLENFPHFRLQPINRPVLLRAARLRATYGGLRSPDAIILATALLENSTLAVTNDKRWKQVKEIETACLQELLS